ncbi:hypothetical protein V1525DRAFT_389484 [Lipomyces kononenkoae]|uniref:Uncharacterized protein n=1 Tax=Lipomyces kononenkoae TaxID=34357 RepID=A0ACC3SXV4_LIPKO
MDAVVVRFDTVSAEASNSHHTRDRQTLESLTVERNLAHRMRDRMMHGQRQVELVDVDDGEVVQRRERASRSKGSSSMGHSNGLALLRFR